MKPVRFDEVNIVLGEDQEEYQALPAFLAADPQGPVVTCWELSPEELAAVQRTGRFWLMQLTFGMPLQPQLPCVDKPLRREEPA